MTSPNCQFLAVTTEKMKTIFVKNMIPAERGAVTTENKDTFCYKHDATKIFFIFCSDWIDLRGSSNTFLCLSVMCCNRLNMPENDTQ